MSERFFSSRRIDGERATLDGPEAHHLLHVMRAAVGDTITLFDGSGVEFDAIVEALRRTEADLRVIQRRETDRELPFSLAVGVALPKGDRQKWLVEKLTELGVTMLVPLVTERSVAQPAANSLERLHRAVIEAAKQCGRNRLMEILGPQPLKEWVAVDPASAALDQTSELQIRRLMAHPEGLPLGDVDVSAPLPTLLAIGPEGGFTDAEVAAARAAGWQQVSLGRRILRTETAAVALTAAISLNCNPAAAAATSPDHSNDAC